MQCNIKSQCDRTKRNVESAPLIHRRGKKRKQKKEIGQREAKLSIPFPVFSGPMTTPADLQGAADWQRECLSQSH